MGVLLLELGQLNRRRLELLRRRGELRPHLLELCLGRVELPLQLGTDGLELGVERGLQLARLVRVRVRVRDRVGVRVRARARDRAMARARDRAMARLKGRARASVQLGSLLVAYW